MQAEKVFNQDQYFKRTVKFVGEPMTHLESIASSAVCSKKKTLIVRKKIFTRCLLFFMCAEPYRVYIDDYLKILFRFELPLK